MFTNKKNEVNNFNRRRFFIGHYLRRRHKSVMVREYDYNPWIPNYPRPKIPPKPRLHSKKFLAKKLDFLIPDKIHSDPIDWNQRIEKLEKYFANISLPSGEIALNPCTTIFDIPGFIESHLAQIKTCHPSSINLPYLERMESLMEILKQTRSKAILKFTSKTD